MNPKSLYWQLRFGRWGRPVHGGLPAEGYTLLVPVPGDLPVFLELALAVCATQDPVNRVETLVLPDHLTPAMRDIVEARAGDWPGRLELLPLPWLDRQVLPRLKDGGRNHGAQLIRGVTRARAGRVLLHDADLFLMDPQVHADEYQLAEKEDVDVLGISAAWDPWFTDRGRQLVATWEQIARTGWYRTFPPHRFIGHDAPVDGVPHTFDTTFWPQFHSPAASCAVGVGLAERVVHFNYTIGSYRAFVTHGPEPFHDNGFRILLIKLFVELFDSGHAHYPLPSLAELAGGLGRADGVRVRYEAGDGAAYRQMRAGLAGVVQGSWSSSERVARCQELLAAFDDFFGLS